MSTLAKRDFERPALPTLSGNYKIRFCLLRLSMPSFPTPGGNYKIRNYQLRFYKFQRGQYSEGLSSPPSLENYNTPFCPLRMSIPARICNYVFRCPPYPTPMKLIIRNWTLCLSTSAKFALSPVEAT